MNTVHLESLSERKTGEAFFTKGMYTKIFEKCITFKSLFVFYLFCHVTQGHGVVCQGS